MAKAHEARDTFNEPGINWNLWGAYGNAQEINGRVETRPDPWTPWSFAGYYSTTLYDLHQSAVTVEVAQILSAPYQAYTYLELKSQWGEADKVWIAAGDGNVYAEQQVGYARTNLLTIPYDAYMHRWWRIRESGGSVFFETSPDGCGWTTQVAVADPFPLNTMMIGFGTGTYDLADADPGAGVFDNLNVPPLRVPIPDRSAQAFDIRVKAAQIARDRGVPRHVNNGEECDYPFVANYSKGLRHDGLGDVDPASYQTLLTALTTRNPADFEAIDLGGQKKLTNPQGGLAFDLEGPDTHAVTMPPAPRIDSPQNSAEMAELYWMALARDVHFNDYAWDGTVAQATQSLTYEFSDFRGPREWGAVTPQTVFRGIFPGETTGPYVSQFLHKGTSDPRLPWGQGRCATDGLITYGDLKIDQRQVTVVPGVDYLWDFPWWLAAQNGTMDMRGSDAVDPAGRRFVRNLRDLGERVHIDYVVDHFYNACLILLNEVPGDQSCGNGRVTVDTEFRLDPGNPYPGYRVQAPFVTFGQPHAITLVTEVLTRALRAVWFQKWFVHRRLRPEEFGGRIHNQLTGQRSYPIDGEILNSLGSGLLSQRFPGPYGTYLLPQAYPEGAPTHPAYGAGHATGSGACATILKAFFDDQQAIESPVVANADGTALVPYGGWDAGQMTVGGELNKLAGNIALGRNAAGVHWRSDYDQSLLMGEKVALGILQEQSILFNEPNFFELTRFDGQRIRIQNGDVFPI
jgi:hypothetical protein